MQEKVQPLPPPDIKIVEGKPPPNSWVSENVVQYLQGQSQSSLLKDVLTYAQMLQAQQLTQTRPKVVSVKEAFTTIPEKGSADDIANASTYNTAQGIVKTQIETLEKMNLLMQQGNPKLAPQMNAMLEQLRQIAQAFPHLSPQQMQSLNTILQQLNNSATSLPANSQRSFWNAQVVMLQTMMGDNKGNIQDYQDEINELQARVQMLQELIKQVQGMKSTLTATPPSPKQFQELIENLQSLANRYGQLNPQQQQALGSFFQQLNQFKSGNGQPLSQVLADALIQNKVNEFMQANPKATPAQVTAFLKSFHQQSNLQSSPLPFLQNLGDSIEDVLDKKGFPAVAGYSGQSFASTEEEGVQPNEEALSSILASFSPSAPSSAALENASGALTGTATEEITDNLQKVVGFTKTVNDLSATQDNLGKAAAWAIGQSYSAGQPPAGRFAAQAAGPVPPAGKGLGAARGAAAPGAAAPGASQQSLPSQFAGAILNHYMPNQQAYLEALAMLLFLDNMGAGFGNTLMTVMNDFNSASTNYDFSNSMHSQPPGFAGSETKAKQQLSNEKTQCSNDINHVNQAQKDIQSQLKQIKKEIDSINNNPNLSRSQKAAQIKILNDMKTSLQGFSDNLKIALTQLTQLKAALSQITIGPPTPPQTASKNFNVYGAGGPPTKPPTGWQSAIGNAENLVINGNPQGNPPGGLVNIASQVTAFQQNYSDQGQNQQMVLQMQMTEIQQEWTVVSTALQLLNQMYMTVAQAIYK